VYAQFFILFVADEGVFIVIFLVESARLIPRDIDDAVLVLEGKKKLEGPHRHGGGSYSVNGENHYLMPGEQGGYGEQRSRKRRRRGRMMLMIEDGKK
jgi:hypothetical protein